MKYRTTQKEVKANCDAVSFGYCSIQSLLTHTNANAYTCGVYGWNSDVYNFGGKAIVTGYRPFGRKPAIPYDKIKEYEKAAEKIIYDSNKPYDERIEEVKSLLAEFVSII